MVKPSQGFKLIDTVDYSDKRFEEAKADLEWALNLLDTHTDMTCLDDEIRDDVRSRWFGDKPWRPAKKRHKSPALKQIRKEIHALKKPELKNSFAVFLADFKAARNQ
jgi:hypothetical protein